VEDAQGNILKMSEELLQACHAPTVGETEQHIFAYFRCLGVTPRFRTITWKGRQATVYAIRSRAGGSYPDRYLVENGVITQIDVSGYRDVAEPVNVVR
jgi:hypothetical protein